jgi:glycine cleavage system H lipoate-binding protein
MDAIRYVDIFATKGIEYLLIIGFLLVLVVVWLTLRPQGRSQAPPAPKARVRHLLPSGWFRVRDVFYHPGHAWAMPERDDVVRIGLDDFTQKLLGNVDGIELPDVGSRLDCGGTAWRLNVDSKSIDMLAPVGGEVVGVNRCVLKDPRLAMEDPYGEGWLLEIRVSDVKASMRNLLAGRYAKAWMDETVRALQGKMVGKLGVLMQDGGTPVSGFAFELSGDDWHELAKEFLLGN